MLNSLLLQTWVAFQSALSRIRDEEGQTLAEYGLIMAVIAVGVVLVAGVAFRGALVGAFDSASSCLNKASSSASC